MPVLTLDFNNFAQGYYTGAEDYWAHYRCGGDPEKRGFSKFCGIDLHNNTEVVRTENGTYSARLFTTRVEEIAASHDANKVMEIQYFFFK